MDRAHRRLAIQARLRVLVFGVAMMSTCLAKLTRGTQYEGATTASEQSLAPFVNSVQGRLRLPGFRLAEGSV